MKNDINNGTIIDENRGTVINQPNGTTVIQRQELSLWDLDSKSLKIERSDCKDKRWDLWSKRGIPFVWMVLGTIFTLIILVAYILPNLFQTNKNDFVILYISLFFGVVLPTVWFAWLRYQDDELLDYYKTRINLITKILRTRGDL